MKELAYEVHELDSRISNKLVITLWWVKNTIETYVTVTDYEAQVETMIDVPEGVSPHEVYNHALAYIPQEAA